MRSDHIMVGRIQEASGPDQDRGYPLGYTELESSSFFSMKNTKDTHQTPWPSLLSLSYVCLRFGGFPLYLWQLLNLPSHTLSLHKHKNLIIHLQRNVSALFLGNPSHASPLQSEDLLILPESFCWSTPALGSLSFISVYGASKKN